MEARASMVRWRVAFFALLALVVVACTQAGKFDPSVPKDVSAACTVLDSGNPLLGALCLTVEEITSIFSHVRATRAAMKAHPELAVENRKVDVCTAPVDSSEAGAQ